MAHIKIIIIWMLYTTIIEAQTASLLFKSSFDTEVIVNKEVSWNHHLQGIDNVSNFTFPNDLPGNNTAHFFNYVVGDMENYSQYANAEIVETTSYNGNTTKALFIEFIRDDPNFISYSRVQYVMYGDNMSNDPVQRMNQGYVKYRIKTHFDTNDTISDWRLPIEWKDMDDDGFRMGLYMYDSNTTSPYWVVKGQYMINGELGNNIWEFSNYDIPVIKDDWFTLEAYWYGHPNSNTGKLKIAINGEILFDVTNQTKDPNQPNKMFYFMPFKVYGTVGYSWITDFEYWNIPPLNSILTETSLSIAAETKIPNQTVYPNPTENTLTVSNEFLGMKYKIVTITGQIIKDGFVKAQKIDVSGMEKGIYFIQISDRTSQKKQIRKWVKY